MTHFRKTACSRDCPDACSLIVELDGDRAIRLRGDKDDPITRGFLCERTNRFLRRQYDPSRFTSPMIRRNGKLEPIAWDDALDLAAEKLNSASADNGAASVLHYRSGGSLGILKQLSDHVFAQWGPVTIKRGDICSGAGEAAQVADFGVSESSDVSDLLESKLIVLWGKNPHTSGVHLLPTLKEAKRRGIPIVSIDPVRTRAASLSDLHLSVRPGADFALAMLLVNALVERGRIDANAAGYCDGLDGFLSLSASRTPAEWLALADLPPADVARFCTLYAEQKPAAILVGWGLARRRNGGLTVRALDAVAAVSGNVGVPGGGASYYFGRRTSFDNDFGFTPIAPPRTLAEARLGQEILAATDPKITHAWITCGNPVSMLPDAGTVKRALSGLDFVVVVDTHPTDTTDLADLVLPTTTLLEDDDLLGAYGNHFLRASRPALTPPPGVRHELEIWQGLASRLGVGAAFAGTPRDFKQKAMRRLSERGITIDALEAGAVRSPLVAPVAFAGRKFETPNGKAQLLQTLPAAPPQTNDIYPMTLLAVSVPEAQSSQWSVPIASGPPEVFVAPSRAGDIDDGDIAELVSEVGALRVRVRHDPTLRADVARMAKGGMLRDAWCANAIVRAVETDVGGGAAYYDEPVGLRKIL